jgi:hypothetical protein
LRGRDTSVPGEAVSVVESALGVEFAMESAHPLVVEELDLENGGGCWREFARRERRVGIFQFHLWWDFEVCFI